MVDAGTHLVTLIGGTLMLLGLLTGLRWTFGTGRDQVGPPTPEHDDATADGLLVEVARTSTNTAATGLRDRLVAAGVRATIGRDGAAYRLLVFTHDAPAARLALHR